MLKISKINGIFQKKVKGKAMFYALFLTLIFAMLSTVVLLSFFSFESAHLSFQKSRKQIKHLQSGINWLLAQKDLNVEKQQISLLGEDWRPIEIGKWDWGLFQVAHVRSVDSLGGVLDTLQRRFLLSNIQSPMRKSALYLSDRGKPLKLVGNAQLVGDIHLPKSGVQAGFVEGQGYKGDSLFYGNSKLSGTDIPSINRAKISTLFESQFRDLPATSMATQGVDLVHSFDDETLKLIPSSGQLTEVSLKGNILLFSEQPLHIGASCVLEDIVIIAPSITFASGFAGSLQAYAREDLTLGKGARLNQPSVLGLWAKDKEGKDPRTLTIEEGAQVDGLVFLLNESYNRWENEVHIKAEAQIKGQLICEGNCHHQGEVIGNLSTNNFRLKTLAASYDNFILDGKIRKNDQEICLPNIFSNQHVKNAVLKWIEK